MKVWLKPELTLIAGLVLGAFLLTGTAAAQRCVSDNDCTRGLARGSNARCVGDTLIKTATRCVAGSCQTREISRRRCATGVQGRCVGQSYQRTEGRCDPLNGTCATRTEREPCNQGCSCKENILVVYTGACSPAIGCHKAVRECLGGCSCDPEPVCKEKEPK